MHIMLCLGGVKICLDCEKEIQIEDVFPSIYNPGKIRYIRAG